jgi:hypothetical protein
VTENFFPGISMYSHGSIYETLLEISQFTILVTFIADLLCLM